MLCLPSFYAAKLHMHRYVAAYRTLPCLELISQLAMALPARRFGEICYSLACHEVVRRAFRFHATTRVKTREPSDNGTDTSRHRLCFGAAMLQSSRTHKLSPEKRPSWSMSRAGLLASVGDLVFPPAIDCGSRDKIVQRLIVR